MTKTNWGRKEFTYFSLLFLVYYEWNLRQKPRQELNQKQ